MLTGKNIVVTGCLQGIGRATLKTFAENGANVFACAYAPNDEFEDFCKDLADRNNVTVTPIYFDMSDNAAVVDAAKKIRSAKKAIHGLVNIAGINRDALFQMVTYKDMLDTFQVNFFTQITFSYYISRIIQHQNGGGA